MGGSRSLGLRSSQACVLGQWLAGAGAPDPARMWLCRSPYYVYHTLISDFCNTLLWEQQQLGRERCVCEHAPASTACKVVFDSSLSFFCSSLTSQVPHPVTHSTTTDSNNSHSECLPTVVV